MHLIFNYSALMNIVLIQMILLLIFSQPFLNNKYGKHKVGLFYSIIVRYDMDGCSTNDNRILNTFLKVNANCKKLTTPHQSASA